MDGLALGLVCGTLAATVYASAPRRESLAAAPVPKKPLVGLFVHTWHDADAKRRVIAETDSFDTNGWYWWGRPAFAKGDMARYTWKNAAMVDYHIDNWVALGVDFVFLDFTNGNQARIMEGARALCDRLKRRGPAAPKLVFWIEKAEFAAIYKKEFYDRYPGIMFQWRGKPLLLVRRTDAGSDRALPPPTLEGFTARWCWGLLGKAGGSMWTFKENDLPKAYVHEGVKEQIGITVATQETYMTTAQGRECRDGGKFFEKQAAHAKAQNPQIITICGYNEWMAMNLGQAKAPTFVDLASPECSHDIEPMQGGHGDAYFKLVRDFIRSLR